VLVDVFLRYMGDLDTWQEGRKAQLSAPLRTQLQSDIAKPLGIAAGEVDRTFGIIRAANASIRAIDAEMVAHANQRARLELGPVPSVMEALKAKRAAAVTSGLSALLAGLGPTSAAGISDFMNNRLNSSIKLFRRPNAR